MSCETTRVLLDAYLDGELAGNDVLTVERHLADCAGCAQALAARRALQQALAAAELRHPLPATAAARWRRTLRAGAPDAPLALPALAARSWTLAAALAAALVAVAIGSFLLGRASKEPASQLADAAVSSHVRSLLGGHPEDVRSSDHHTVKPWFSGKLDFAPVVVDLGAQGFPLTGGRLDDVGGRRVAALVYRAGAHTVSLFTWPQPGSACADPGAAEVRRGFRVLAWSCDGMAYVAVSDAAAEPLRAFAHDLDAVIAGPAHR
jgi:anti-sigma factor RsiW